MNRKLAVVFDLDGTIWDASSQVARSWTKTLSRLYGESFEITPERMKSCMGMSMDAIAKALLPESKNGIERTKALEIAQIEENDYLRTHPGSFYPGIQPAIERIAEKADVYILSNCQTGYIEAMLSSANFAHLVKGHACYGDCRLEKAENLRRLIEKEGIEKAVYVGDTLHDEEETHKAGLKFIFAEYGFGMSENPDASAPAPSSVYALAKQLLGW